MSASYIPPPSLPLSGSPPDMTGPIYGKQGSIAAPGYAFSGANSTGVYWDSTNNVMGFSVGGASVGYFSSTGSLGSGLTGLVSYVPGGTASVRAAGETGASMAATNSQNTAAGPSLILTKTRGTITVPLVDVKNDQLGVVSGRGHNGTGNQNAWRMLGILSETGTPSSTAFGAQVQISMNPIGSVTLTEVMRLDNESGLSMFGANPVIDANRVFRNRIFTVATLPTGASGMSSFVSDALGPTFGAAVVGGGAVPIPVYHDGTSWKVG